MEAHLTILISLHLGGTCAFIRCVYVYIYIYGTPFFPTKCKMYKYGRLFGGGTIYIRYIYIYMYLLLSIYYLFYTRPRDDLQGLNLNQNTHPTPIGCQNIPIYSYLPIKGSGALPRLPRIEFPHHKAAENEVSGLREPSLPSKIQPYDFMFQIQIHSSVGVAPLPLTY